jgi:RNA-splicing ligase RtcB
MTIYTGHDLIKLGFAPNKSFPKLLEIANSGTFDSDDSLKECLSSAYYTAPPTIPLQDPSQVTILRNIDSGRNEYEQDNVRSVDRIVANLAVVPTVRQISIMPDACPAGNMPVGVIASTKSAIHPGFHSADICCSMFLTSVDSNHSANEVLDAVVAHSHFGPGGRPEFPLSESGELFCAAKENSFLNDPAILSAMSAHLGTQGDGNHFFFVGKKQSTGDLTLVTHHGSRKPGALLFKKGMAAAKRHTAIVSPATPLHASWLDYDTVEGKSYWDALQIIREWTKLNHTTIHNGVMAALGLDADCILDRFWNEHNFVFKDGDMFNHAKGATPVTGNHATDADADGRTIIPLNMSEPILIVKNSASNVSGFAPHGAGRNYSRTKHNKLNAGRSTAEIMEDETANIDVRFYSGKPDISELPSAYKNAQEVQDQIVRYGLATVVDKIMPLGSVMAGEQYQPWKKIVK